MSLTLPDWYGIAVGKQGSRSQTQFNFGQVIVIWSHVPQPPLQRRCVIIFSRLYNSLFGALNFHNCYSKDAALNL